MTIPVNEDLREAILEIVSETQKSPGSRFVKVMSQLNLDFGGAEEIDKVYSAFYHDDLHLELRRRDAEIKRLTDALRDYEDIIS